MIARLEGKILSFDDGVAVLDVGGVGFAVAVPLNVELPLGERAVLYTYLSVRETDLSLYGFPDPDQKALFELLLGVSGVGPKAALSMMGTLAPDTLRQAIVNRQPEVLARAPGIGKKTSEAIVLHLKDKVARRADAGAAISDDDADVIGALTALGFSIVEAQRALQQLPRDSALSLDDKIRQALALLGK